MEGGNMKVNNRSTSRIDPDDAPKKPFIFTGNKEQKQKPFTFINDNINSEKKFVINRLTDNGAYIKGGMLYFRINGVDIFTDINHSLFIDKSNNTVIVKTADNLENIEDKTEPELRQYIILIYSTDENAEEFRWESMTGRTLMYEYIRDNIEYIDPDHSIILTENVAVKDAFTASQFVKYLQNANLVEDDDFDIDLYSTN